MFIFTFHCNGEVLIERKSRSWVIVAGRIGRRIRNGRSPVLPRPRRLRFPVARGNGSPRQRSLACAWRSSFSFPFYYRFVWTMFLPLYNSSYSNALFKVYGMKAFYLQERMWPWSSLKWFLFGFCSSKHSLPGFNKILSSHPTMFRCFLPSGEAKRFALLIIKACVL